MEAVATRAAEKILPEGVEIFFRLLVLPLGLCFCEQSGGMTKTALPIRFKPAWAGLLTQKSFLILSKEMILDIRIFFSSSLIISPAKLFNFDMKLIRSGI